MSPTVEPIPELAHAAALRRWWHLALLVAAIVSLVGCGSTDARNSAQPTFSYIIPVGSADEIENGATLDIWPREILAQLDETIQIVNEDDQAHILGPWFVGPGETLRQRFTEPGVFEGSCSVHPSGRFTVIVEA